MKSLQASLSSNFAMLFPTADLVMPNWSAAEVKLPVLAAVTKITTPLKACSTRRAGGH
jgi:hypothetical protein